MNRNFGLRFNTASSAAIYLLILALALVSLTSAVMAQQGTGVDDARPVVHRFAADPGIVGPGENTTLKWNVSGASAIAISPGSFRMESDPSQSLPLWGSIVAHPPNSTNYTLTASGAGGSATNTTRVLVMSQADNVISSPATGTASMTSTNPALGAGNPVVQYFQASPQKVRAGESAVLTWSASNADEILIAGVGKVEPTGSMTVTPAQSSSYILTARNSRAVVTASTEVLVEVPGPVINFFSAYPDAVYSGERATLSWKVTGASSVTIDGLGSYSSSGSVPVFISKGTVFTLRASNAGGTAVASTQVSVVERPPAPPVIQYFRSDRSRIQEGDSARLSWRVSGASRVFIEGISSLSSTGMYDSITVSPTRTTTYILTASNTGGSVRSSVTVEVIKNPPPPPVIHYFQASDEWVTDGDSTTLSWSVSGATSVSVNGRRVGSSGSQTVRPSSPGSSYTLTASNEGNSDRRSIYVNVLERMPSFEPEKPVEPFDPGMSILPI